MSEARMTGKGSTRRRFLAGTGAVVAGSYLFDRQLAWAALSASRRPVDEDGYELWLRYRLVDRPDLLSGYQRALTHVVVPNAPGQIVASAAAELVSGLSGLLGREIRKEAMPAGDGAVILGTPDSSALIAGQIDATELERLGPEGYVLRRRRVNDADAVLVASAGDRGVLYGAFHLLRLLQTHQRIEQLDIAERPANPLRLANHWDNLDRTVERGYAGLSIFHWDELPEMRARYTDYARALASVGMNGTVVNNVNANAQFLSSEMIQNLVPLADILRAWGVTFHLSANFASPIVLGGLATADPFDPAVQAWWRDKADEFDDHIPDFGGFLVKANSEGQPGPLDYGRTHADGANMLAEALRPHGGIVMWRAFVWHDAETWAQEAYETFQPLDAEFADNVIVQIKNGPIDFQVREPVHPLFGALPNTNSMLELQVTQEYTGQSTHLCYAVPQWKQAYGFDTRAAGTGTTVANIVDGSAYGYSRSGVAGVMNFGSDTNWTRHHLAAANTHGYGRLAWNPALEAESIAEEWVRMTFGSNAQVVQVLSRMLLSSWEIYESYNSPLGAGFMHGGGDHFDPCPACNVAWHQSDGQGTGFDRTVATGSGTTALYHPPVSDIFESLDTCPDELLLFFHHVPYMHRLHSGKTVIQHIYDSHFEGLDDAHRLRRLWQAQEARIDSRRHREVLERFDRQVEHATQWRDMLVAYWFSHSRILDERRSWAQVKVSESSRVLLDGWPNLVRLTVGNASSGELEVTAALETPEGWTSGSTSIVLSSRELAEVSVPVRLAIRSPEITTVQADIDAAGKEVLSESAEVVTTPAGQRCVLALDAGSASSPLLTSYRRLTPGDVWDAEKGYGWIGTAPQSRDRGGLDPLRQDFVNDIPARTLRIAVPAGVYDTYLLVGDASVSSHPTYVRSGGELLAESEFLFGGEFSWLHFTLNGGTDGREMDLELSSVPGEHWHLVALAIVDPDAEIPPVVVTEVDVAPLMFGGRDHTATVHVANTTSTEDLAVTVHVVAPDGWSTQDTTASVSAGEFAELDVSVRPDLTPVLTTLQIDVSAEGQEDDSRLVAVMAVPPGDDVALALDAGNSTSPLLETYHRLSPAHTWDSAQGYGWVGSAPQSRDRGGLDPLRRDFVNDIPARTLRIAVPAGSHDVYLLVGDTLASRPTYVRSDGELLAESEPLGGGDFAWLHFTLDGGSTGLEVDLELESEPDEHWHLNALVMR